jgi:TonB-dependent SusC/RagA subfamily outer membrane receptor
MSRDPLSTARRAVGIVACATCVVTLHGCHQRSSVGDEPSVMTRRFPGVELVSTGTGGFHVRILSGLVGSGEPLYVIDGNPMAIDSRRGIDWFKPEDIVRISVLKSPSDIAVYGARGVNGVILITTRQGTTPRL